MRAAPLSIRPLVLLRPKPCFSTALALIVNIIITIGEMSASDARLAGGLESLFG